jgi:DNA modification methylase
MESRVIQLTEASFKHGNLNLRACGRDFFPLDIFGGSTKDHPGNPITLKIDSLNKTIETDIPTDKKTGNPRWIFRKRKWVKDFVHYHKLHPGDAITITRLNQKMYQIGSNNNLSQAVSNDLSNKQTETLAKTGTVVKTPKTVLNIDHNRTCNCSKNHINCLTPKEWVKNQVAIWELYYEKRDIRDKDIHPAVFPISLPKRCIELFTHRGELVLDPFSGIGSTLIAARDLARNAVGFDLNQKYIDYSNKRLSQLQINFGDNTKQVAICDDAINIPKYLNFSSLF